MVAKFIKSATQFNQYPPGQLPEVAVVGRSNAGKSSLLNSWFGHRLAKTSQTPGKTQLLNFYQVEETYSMVDLPGYGYASLSRTEKELWAPMIENYLESRENLVGVMLIADVKRPWSQDEESLVNWLRMRDLEVWVVFNKIDKLNQKERAAREKDFLPVTRRIKSFWISTKTGSGIDGLRRTVFENLTRP